MSTLSATLTRDHRHCDELFAQTEEHASRGNWAEADACLSKFIQAMEHHLRFEEENFFPAFEQATGSQQGPTQMMRLEHEQMRALFRDMQASLPAHDARQFLGITETLLILMQQHNLKEEHVLYRLADQALGANGLALSAQFAQS